MITRIMAAILFVASSLTSHAMGVEDFVNELLRDYPKARLLDIYKSCFQDYMGAEHLVGERRVPEATSCRNSQQSRAATYCRGIMNLAESRGVMCA